MILDVQQLLKGFPATVKIHVGVILEFQLVHFSFPLFFGGGVRWEIGLRDGQ